MRKYFTLSLLLVLNLSFAESLFLEHYFLDNSFSLGELPDQKHSTTEVESFLDALNVSIQPNINGARFTQGETDYAVIDEHESVLPMFYSGKNTPNKVAMVNSFVDQSLKDRGVLKTQPNNQRDNATFHLFSHGKSAELFIKDEWLTADDLVTFLSPLLQDKTHLNIYGCHFAKGEKGRAAVAYLEATLGVSVAASDDITGVDGDWDLEVGNTKQAIQLPNYRYNLQCVSTSACIGGKVFEDFNCNGADDADAGIQGVQIEVYDCNNNLVGTGNSDSDGDWQVCSLTDGDTYRIEVVVPANLSLSHVGTDNGSSVQFVQPGSCTDFALLNPLTACFNPTAQKLMTTCFTIGDPLAGGVREFVKNNLPFDI